MSQVAGSCPPLPLEIWDVILDFNHGDEQTLAHCSLVCRDWLPTCRMHRFSEFKVTPRVIGRPEAASLLCDPTSTVLPYIRSLILMEGLPNVEGLSDADLDYEDRDSGTRILGEGGTTYWFNDILPEIRTGDLTALEGLSLQALRWESLSSTSRRSVVGLCHRLRSLQVITLGPRDIPCMAVIELLRAAPSLKHFTILLPKQAFVPPINPSHLPPRSEANATLALDSLRIDNAVARYLQGLPYHFSTLHITKLSLCGLGKNDVEAFISFVRLCSTSLQHLSLQIDDPYPIWGEADDYFIAQGGFSCAAYLRSLTLEAGLFCIPALLRQVTSPHLVDLTVKILVTQGMNKDAFEQRDNMDELTQSLTTGALAATRPRISFFLMPWDPGLPVDRLFTIRDAHDILLANLTSLRGEGRLRVMRCTEDPLTYEDIIEDV